MTSLVMLVSAGGCGVTHSSYIKTDEKPRISDWPQSRGDLNRRGWVTSPFVEPDGALWTSRTGGIVTNAPVVVGGALFLGGTDRRVEGFDLASGDRMFRRRFDGPVNGVVQWREGIAFAVDHKEYRLFYYPEKGAYGGFDTRIGAMVTPPIPVDDRLLIGDVAGRLRLLDSEGEPLWTVRGDPVHAAPIVTGETIIAAGTDGVVARSLDDGAQLWGFDPSGAVLAGCTVADSTLFFGSLDSMFYALDVHGGDLRWFFPTDGQIISAPAVDDHRVYFGSNDRHIYALDRTSGSMVWRRDIGVIANVAPTVWDNVLIVGARDRRLLLIDAANGTVRREFQTRGGVTAPPVVSDNRIYIVDDSRRLTCFGKVNGALPALSGEPGSTGE